MSLDYSQEPEKIWKASLLKHQNEAYFFLFVAADYCKAWEVLIGWIGTLNAASQENLGKITIELEGAVFDRQHIKPKRGYAIFREISAHVYNCYLSQGGFGMINTATLPKGSGPKAPEKKPYTEAKATL